MICSIEDAKKKAWAARSFLATAGCKINYGNSLNLVATISGFRDWNAMSRSLDNSYIINGKIVSFVFEGDMIHESADSNLDLYSARVFSKLLIDENPFIHALLAEWEEGPGVGLIDTGDKYIQLFEVVECYDALEDIDNILQSLRIPYDFISLQPDEYGHYQILLKQCFTDGCPPSVFGPIALYKKHQLDEICSDSISPFQVAISEIYNGGIFPDMFDVCESSEYTTSQTIDNHRLFFYCYSEDISTFDFYNCYGEKVFSHYYTDYTESKTIIENGEEAKRIGKEGGFIPSDAFVVSAFKDTINRVLIDGEYSVRISNLAKSFSTGKPRIFEYIDSRTFEVAQIFPVNQIDDFSMDPFIIVPEYALHNPMVAVTITNGGHSLISSGLIDGHVIILHTPGTVGDRSFYYDSHIVLANAGIPHYAVWATQVDESIVQVTLDYIKEPSDVDDIIVFGYAESTLTTEIGWGSGFDQQLRVSGLSCNDIILSILKQEFGSEIPLFGKNKTVDPILFWNDHISLLDHLFFFFYNYNTNTFCVYNSGGDVVCPVLRCNGDYTVEGKKVLEEILGVDSDSIVDVGYMPDENKPLRITNMSTGDRYYISMHIESPLDINIGE